MHTILLTGAALVGLPILLHLIMKQEPKRLSFPAFRFLTQKLKTNQRKLRLRHFVLLAMRMLLIALFCLALYQPTLLSDSFNLRGEQPVAVVLVIDTSPSMGYTANERTRLQEAIKRANELLDELPAKSVVAIVDTAELNGYWLPDVAAARRRLDELDRPRGGVQPVTSAVAVAYQLLAKIESPDADDADQFPKLVAVFSDRMAAGWDSSRADDLKKLRDQVPDPKPAHAFVDVGIDQPVNVALLAAEMKPQIIQASQPAVVGVSVAATGSPDAPPVEASVLARLDDSGTPLRRAVTIPYGQSRVVTFEFPNLKPGWHQVEFRLETPDKLLADNTRFLTFKVGESRRLLVITDDPEAAVFWQAGLLAAKEPFSCRVVSPGDVRTDTDGRTVVQYAPNPAKPDEQLLEPLAAFEAVCLLSVREPNQPAGNTLWDKLRPYVERNGKLIVIPGDETLKIEDYAAAADLMPGTFTGVIDTRKLDPPPPPQTAPGWDGPRNGAAGVTWFLDDRVVQHPLLQPFQDWQSKGNVDAVKNPRRAWKYWEVQKADTATVIVSYHDADQPARRRPAVLERTVADPKDPTRAKGKVILLTTRMDVPREEADNWHDYWETEGSTWFSVFPWMVVRYLTGDTADANFNFLTGQSVTVPLPKGGLGKTTKILFDGPGIVGSDAIIEAGDRQTELRLGPPRTNLPGNYMLTLDAGTWREGFSLNIPAEESNLEKVPVEAIEELTGKNSVVPVDRNLSLWDALARTFNQPIDLFPWLLIAVLLLLVLEGLIANRFYRKVR
jgi:hypothetical protein